MSRKKIILSLDPDPGITLKTLYDICTFAEENYPELQGIRPLQRVEAGLGLPKKPGDRETFYKAKLLLGCNRGLSLPQYCRWNLWIPDNWKEELPKHRLFHTSINNKSQKEADAFAHCQGTGIPKKKDRIMLTLDCTYEKMPSRMFNALKNALRDMRLLAEKSRIRVDIHQKRIENCFEATVPCTEGAD
jgi:hypothetical protein